MAEFQYQNRRDFIKYLFGTSMIVSGMTVSAENQFRKKGVDKLTILYTNDTHSRIEPFPSNDPKYANLGGFANRAAIINEIRATEKNVLLLDAGDIFQGTPYFNFYAGELEYKLMSSMKYDCTTLGNHDFDLGVENIVKQLPHASFEILNANYDLSNTELANKIKPYKIFIKEGIKIGVIGVGIELAGLVDKKLSKDIHYLNPIKIANDFADKLKHDEKCDYVILLSHLGYVSDAGKINDQLLAKETTSIDLIIGGHTHTFLENPTLIKNIKNKNIFVTQVGWAGIWLGRIDVYFDRNNFFKTAHASNFIIKNSL